MSKFVEKAIGIHGDKYDYSKVEYAGSKVKVCIICPEHGEFMQRPDHHLSGHGCPPCGIREQQNSRTKTNETFIKDATEKHKGRYDYSKANYTKVNEKVCIICPVHGEFWQTPNGHLRGQGCPKCNGIVNKPLVTENTKNTLVKPKQKLTDYATAIPPKSNEANKLFEFVKSLFPDAVQNKPLGKDSYVFDVYIPSKRCGIVLNDLFRDSEACYPNRNYHLTLLERCENCDKRLLTIFEDEWVNKQEIVKSRIQSILGVNERTIYARKCDIREVTYKESELFLTENHLQGNVMSKYRYGLYYQDELVSLMTFGKRRKNLGAVSEEGLYELLRFCGKRNTNVVGAASRLLKHFIKEVKPLEITSYADRRWSDGNLYTKLGFELTHYSSPSYFYVINGKRENRFKYRKNELIKEGFDANKTEHQIMLDRGIYRIYDCGSMVFKLHFE